MDLLNRYLQAVGRFLPAETKEDTLAELRANLLETMEDRADELGRPLTDADVSALLKAHGKPEMVAMRYLPQRSLIGPAVFPFYLFTLKRALPFVVAIYAVARTMALLFGPAPESMAAAVAVAIWEFWPVLLTFWAVITLIFAVLERTHDRLGQVVPWSDWDPAKLPRVDRTTAGGKGKSMPARVGDLVMQVLSVAYLLALPSHPYLVLGPGAVVMHLALPASSPWPLAYVGILALMVMQVVLRAIGLRRMGRQTDLAITIGVKVLSVATLLLIVAVKVYFVPRQFTPDVSDLVYLTNHWVNLGFQVVLAISAADLLWEIWKAARNGAVFPAAPGRVSL